MKRVLLVNIETLKRDSYIDANVDNNVVRVAVGFVQDSIIENVIGTCLYDKLADLVATNEICDPENACYKELLDDYLFPIFQFAVQAKLAVPLAMKERNAGIIRANDETFTQVSYRDINLYKNEFASDAAFYQKRAIDFLRCNKECFGNICGCGGCCKRAPYNIRLNTPLYLGNTYKKGRFLW